MKKKQSEKNSSNSKPASKIDDCYKFENPKVHPELKSYFAYCLTKSAARLRALMDERLKPHNIIAPLLGMLRLIELHGEVSQSEIALTMGIDKATMVKFVDGLEKSKYVIRTGCAKDRRIKYLSLTAAGKKMLAKGNQLREEVEKEFLSPLTATEKAALEKALPKLVR